MSFKNSCYKRIVMAIFGLLSITNVHGMQRITLHVGNSGNNRGLSAHGLQNSTLRTQQMHQARQRHQLSSLIQHPTPIHTPTQPTATPSRPANWDGAYPSPDIRNQAPEPKPQQPSPSESRHSDGYRQSLSNFYRPNPIDGLAIMAVGAIKAIEGIAWLGNKIFGSSETPPSPETPAPASAIAAPDVAAASPAQTASNQTQAPLDSDSSEKSSNQSLLMQQKKLIKAQQLAAQRRQEVRVQRQSLKEIDAKRTLRKKEIEVALAKQKKSCANKTRKPITNIPGNGSAFDPIGMEGFQATTLDKKAITKSITQTKKSIESYKATAGSSPQAEAMYATVTHFNNVAEQCNKNGHPQQASNFAKLASQLTKLGTCITEGIERGTKNAQKKTEHIHRHTVMEPGKVVENIGHYISEVTLTMAEMMLEGVFTATNPEILKTLGYKRPEAFRKKIAAEFAAFNALPRSEKIKTAVSFFTEQSLLGIGGAGMQQMVLPAGAAEYLGTVLTQEARGSNRLSAAKQTSKSPISHAITEAAEIRQCLASKKAEEAAQIINTVRSNPGIVAEVGSLTKAVAQVTSFNTAKNGGRHSGFYNQYINKSIDEIRKGTQSLGMQIAEHQEKISNPEKFIPHFKSLDPRQQSALINKKWPSDILRQIEQKEILEGILLMNKPK